MLTLEQLQYLLLTLTGAALILYFVVQHIWYLHEHKWLMRLFCYISSNIESICFSRHSANVINK